MSRPLKTGEKILFWLFGIFIALAIIMFTLLEWISTHRSAPLYPTSNLYNFTAEGLQGQRIYLKNNCSSCHRAMRSGTSMGLILDGLGSLHDYDYFYNFLKFPEKTYRGGNTIDHGMPPKEAAYVAQLPEQDLKLLARFLSELKAAPGSATAPAPPPGDSNFIDTMTNLFAPERWKQRAAEPTSSAPAPSAPAASSK